MKFHVNFKTDSAFAVGDYVAVFDPIDGSKNIDASLPVGSIFAIYKKKTRPMSGGVGAGDTSSTKVDDTDFLLDGKNIVAAGYCLFS